MTRHQFNSKTASVNVQFGIADVISPFQLLINS
jgi:hypothetical protein